jgi:hypothetical protein
MAQALQSAQQSLQQAGQQQASGKQGQQEASEAEMGQEMGQQSGQSGSQGQGGQSQGDKGSQRNPGSGMGKAGIGVGGHAGAQQPLPGVKKDSLVRGSVNDKGEKMSRSYRGTPDPTKDRAAYYSMVPDRIKAQEASLNREEIPTGYKKAVRDYFDSIQPR